MILKGLNESLISGLFTTQNRLLNLYLHLPEAIIGAYIILVFQLKNKF